MLPIDFGGGLGVPAGRQVGGLAGQAASTLAGAWASACVSLCLSVSLCVLCGSASACPSLRVSVSACLRVWVCYLAHANHSTGLNEAAEACQAKGGDHCITQ